MLCSCRIREAMAITPLTKQLSPPLSVCCHRVGGRAGSLHVPHYSTLSPTLSPISSLLLPRSLVFFVLFSHLAISVISASVICSDTRVHMLVCARVCLEVRGLDETSVCVGPLDSVWLCDGGGGGGIKRCSNRSSPRAIDSQSP